MRASLLARSCVRRCARAPASAVAAAAVFPVLCTPSLTPTASFSKRGFSIRNGLNDSTHNKKSGANTSGDEHVIHGGDGGTTAGKGADYSARIHNDDRPFDPNARVKEEHPIIQLPARTLWSRQYPLSAKDVAAGAFTDMVARVKAARHYYQYPSLCAPQIGWNVQMFTLFDDTVYINPVDLDAEAWKAGVDKRYEELDRQKMMTAAHASPGHAASAPVVKPAREPIDYMDQEERHVARLRQQGKTCFAWEPCASCCFLMHYIERPATLRLRALNEKGEEVHVELDGVKARFALHEMDHLNGILFTRRVVDTDHVVPLDGFNCMSDWSDDYPSLEARSTFLYTTFTPPHSFRTESVDDANLLDRKFEDGVYPGCELDRQMRIQSVAFQSIQRDRWRSEENKGGATVAPAEAAEEGEEGEREPPKADA